jgi:hypothetical protein
LCRNPCSDESEQRHGNDNTSQDERIAGIGLIDEESKDAAGENAQK